MKTYLVDTIERFKRFSQSLDVKALLCSKAWYVLNEDGDTENLIFQPDGTVLVSVNGEIKKYTWQYIPQNQSLSIMHSEAEGTMLRSAFIDGTILVFNKIGTKECMFLVDDSLSEENKLYSLNAVQEYLIHCEERALEQQRILEAQKQEEEYHRQEEIKAKHIAFQRELNEIKRNIEFKKQEIDSILSSEHSEVIVFYCNNREEIVHDYERRALVAAVIPILPLFFTIISLWQDLIVTVWIFFSSLVAAVIWLLIVIGSNVSDKLTLISLSKEKEKSFKKAVKKMSLKKLNEVFFFCK